MTEVPAKIELQGTWVPTRILIQNDHIRISDPTPREIPYKTIIDLQEKKNVLTLTLKGEDESVLRLASVEKVLQILKRMITVSCSAYRLMAYFMSPAIQGGVLVTNAAWEKGAIAVLRTGLWFVNQNKQVCVPLADITSIELTERDIQGKQTDVIKIDHLESGEVITSFVLCPLSTLQILHHFLKDATKELEMGGDELDTLAAQVAMLVYSGMDSHAIEQMLHTSHTQVDGIYDKLMTMGLAEVVCIRKEVQLTPKGVRYISDALKSQNK